MRKLSFLYFFLCFFSWKIFSEEAIFENSVVERSIYSRHTIRPPFYMIRDQTLPFWDFGGSTTVSESYIRITPKVKNRSGWLWNTQPLMLGSWQIEIMFQVQGPHQTGGEGLAIWITDNKLKPGDCFGSESIWKGLGVFFDTHDNNRNEDNPRITAILNDGTKQFLPQYDNIVQENPQNGCSYNFRGSSKHKARITYDKPSSQITIEVLNQGPKAVHFEHCTTFKAPQMHGHLIGVSASTGQFSDNHDLYYLVTYGIHTPTNPVEKEQKEATIRLEKREEIQHQQPSILSNKADKFSAQYSKVLEKLKSFKERKDHEHGKIQLALDEAPEPSKSLLESITTPETLFEELLVQLKYISKQQQMIIKWVNSIKEMVHTEKEEIRKEHERFALDFSRLISQMASRTELLNLFSSQDSDLVEREKAQISSLESESVYLRDTIERVTKQTSRDINLFGPTLTKIKNDMDISHFEITKIGSDVTDKHKSNHEAIRSSTSFPISIYLISFQIVFTIVYLIISRSNDIKKDQSLFGN